ncbi:arsenate reductase family protein [Ornithinibacillus sp. 4-3]|uniref:Arsenate reductase family protein n=1 Tax=Ornithinibacillus sp. 4-3 TaxID=3231488 RepID=A0AB39HNI4_9BACI
MALTFYWYPNCGTCKKAKKWLEENNKDFEIKHIVEETPSKEMFLDYFEKADVPERKFFNTSGKVYREQGMKDKLKDASVEEMATYLASNGMLVKRPITTDGEKVTVGFNEAMFEENWL